MAGNGSKSPKAKAPAAGRIEEPAAREDGIRARIAWTPTGKAKITRREYRVISPRDGDKGGHGDGGDAGGPDQSASHRMKALCAVEGEPPQTDLPADDAAPDDAAKVIAMLREALGAAPDTPVPELIRKARAIFAAADGLRTDNLAAKEMASSTMKLLTELHDDKMETALERARASGKLVPAMEGWAQELASSNLDSFDAWADCARPALHLGPPLLAGRTPPPELLERGRFRGSNERMAICSQPGLAHDQIADTAPTPDQTG